MHTYDLRSTQLGFVLPCALIWRTLKLWPWSIIGIKWVFQFQLALSLSRLGSACPVVKTFTWYTIIWFPNCLIIYWLDSFFGALLIMIYYLPILLIAVKRTSKHKSGGPESGRCCKPRPCACAEWTSELQGETLKGVAPCRNCHR
jgi:hypothetical protein